MILPLNRTTARTAAALIAPLLALPHSHRSNLLTVLFMKNLLRFALFVKNRLSLPHCRSRSANVCWDLLVKDLHYLQQRIDLLALLCHLVNGCSSDLFCSCKYVSISSNPLTLLKSACMLSRSKVSLLRLCVFV